MAWGGSKKKLPPQTFSHGGAVKNFPPRHFPMGGKFAPKNFGACGGLESYYVVFSLLDPSITHLLVASPPQAEIFDICCLFSLRKCNFLKENRHLDGSIWQNSPPAAGHPNHGKLAPRPAAPPAARLLRPRPCQLLSPRSRACSRISPSAFDLAARRLRKQGKLGSGRRSLSVASRKHSPL